MRVVSLLFMLILTCTGFSQNNMQPQARVAQLKAAGTTFSTFSPFAATSQLRTKDYSTICNNCKVFTADPATIYRFSQQSPDQLLMQIPQRGVQPLELELYQVELFPSGQPNIETSDGQIINELPTKGKHYRGIIKGENQSIVAVSIYEENIMGLISSPATGDWVLTQVDDKPGEYLYYEAKDLNERHTFDCATADSYRPYRPEELAPQTDLRSNAPCLQVYLEIDNDVYQDKGGTQGTVDYITGIFNEVAVLYANENINMQLSKLFLWTGTSPYNATNSFDMLRQFQAERTSIEGDIGQLISYKASGGIAVVDGLCQSRTAFKLSFSSINRSFRSVPNYSYTVMVVAHELGHILGSQHTHACVWNGNSTAIDGCAGFVEGNCAIPSTPSGGGTLMSYCHITGVGINFSKGLGQQPGNLIRNRIAGASCLQVCSTGGGGGNPPDNGSGSGGSDLCAKVTFELTLDLFGSETSWDIRDEAGNLIASGSGYENKKAGQIITENLCLAEGCYTLTMNDSDGDGICCAYGQGGFAVKDSIGTILTNGAQFGATDTKSFCVVAPVPGNDDNDGDDDNNNDDGNCVSVNFNETQINGFGGSQDRGTATIIEGGKGVLVQGNAWKSIPLAYNVTRETVLRFDFKSTKQPEIAGVGLDENTSISSSRTFLLYGSQSWGIRTFKNYSGDGEWTTYEIPIGTFYTGQMQNLFFSADHDRSPRDGNAYFRNFYLYETTPCDANLAPNTASLIPERSSSINVFPNPGNEHVFFDILSQEQEVKDGQLAIYNVYGQQVKIIPIQETGRIQISTQDLTPGTYLYKLNGLESEYTGKFSIQR